jgi:ADP-glucose pyrophosphorylase
MDSTNQKSKVNPKLKKKTPLQFDAESHVQNEIVSADNPNNKHILKGVIFIGIHVFFN